MIPYRDIEQAERIETPLSTEMTAALDLWQNMYLNKAPWMADPNVKSLNLPAFIASEIARQIVLEMKWNITGKAKDADGNVLSNPRADYLKAEFQKCVDVLRRKLEPAGAAGGMTIRPWAKPDDPHIHFAYDMDWAIYPLAFDDNGDLADVIFLDSFSEGSTVYTRLERHTVKLIEETDDDGNVINQEMGIEITQKAFKSNNENYLGQEIKLKEVPRWAHLPEKVPMRHTDGLLFGWYRVANANNVDATGPMSASVYAKAVDLIRDADEQYSSLKWEYTGGEMAVDVDETALRPAQNGRPPEMPQHAARLFRKLNLETGGGDDFYSVFAPALRDDNYINGLNQILMRVEDQCGLARGTISDANEEARTATEIKIVKQRSYVTIADNQKALEKCLLDVIRAMDKYASLYKLAPEGEYDVSFEWDDSIITDSEQEANELIAQYNAGLISGVEYRMRKFGETEAQAEAAFEKIREEKAKDTEARIPGLPGME